MPEFLSPATGLTKADVGLSNVDNTSDASKPVSTAQASADTASKARGNHTGTQPTSTISDFVTATDTRIANSHISGSNNLTMAVIVANGAVAPTGLPVGTLIVELV